MGSDEIAVLRHRARDRAGVRLMSANDESVPLPHNDGGVRTLTLNRPHRKNAIDAPLWDALADALRAVDSRRLRALALTGAGGAFCSVADISTPEACTRAASCATNPCRTGPARADRADHREGHRRRGGGGLEPRARLRFCGRHPESKFSKVFAMRAVRRPPRLVAVIQAGRSAEAKRLAPLAEMIDATRRHRWASATRPQACERRRVRRRLARRLAAGPPVALAQSKALLNDGAMRHCARRWPTRPAPSRAISPPQTLWRRTRRSPRSGPGVHWTMGCTIQIGVK